MKQFTIRTVGATFAALLLASFAQAADPLTKEQEALMQRERDGAQAFLKGDAKAVAALEADEYVYTDYDGSVYYGRDGDVDSLKDGSMTFKTFDVDDMKAMVYGDTGVVVGRATQNYTWKGSNVAGVYRFTDTFVKRDGRWQLVASQSTRIEKP